MQTRREYLAEKGLAKIGRGKFSNDAKAELVRAEKAGIKFSDSEPKPKVEKPDKPTAKVEKVGIIADVRYTYPEDTYRAFEKGTKTERSMREVCQNCRVSLVGHRCDNPVIVSTNSSGSVAVTIEKR